MGKQHTIAQGESAESIAFDEGHLCDTVWNDPGNDDLRKTRKSPHVLLPGDSLFIPDIKPKTIKCPTGQRHTFQRKGIPSKLTVRFLVDGKPRAGKAYTFTVDGGKKKDGTTDGDGWLKESVSPGATQAVVRFKVDAVVDPDLDPAPFAGGGDVVREDADEEPPSSKAPEPEHVYVLDLRYLDPASEVSGAQGRLSNLGYPCDAIDGDLGPRTKEALQAFQKDNGLDVSGELDDATKSKLETFAKG
ncbi:MAG TPA: peptidoglycan-binding domain-containing protein [Polyangiaceae bacterium]|jgi:N-acetylmuramoyl-L-alanine amidase